MSIFGDRVTVPSVASSAEWLLSGLGQSSTVGALVPSGFERYAFVRRSPWDEVDDEGAKLASELAVLAERHTSTPSPWSDVLEVVTDSVEPGTEYRPAAASQSTVASANAQVSTVPRSVGGVAVRPWQRSRREASGESLWFVPYEVDVRGFTQL